MSAHTFDDCPTCGKNITDVDPGGCEAENGQRYCLDHLPREADPELFDSYRAFLASGTV